MREHLEVIELDKMREDVVRVSKMAQEVNKMFSAPVKKDGLLRCVHCDSEIFGYPGYGNWWNKDQETLCRAYNGMHEPPINDRTDEFEMSIKDVQVDTGCQHLLRDEGDCVWCGQHLRSVGKYATLRELHNGAYCESCESKSKYPWTVLDPAKGDSK